MRKLIVTILLAFLVCPAFGQQAGVSYTDIWRWHGWSLYEENIIHTSIDASVRGIDVSAVSHYENEDNDLKKWDTCIGYQLPIENLIIKPSYGYVFLPCMDAQEIGLTVALPGSISPRYSIYHIIPDDSQNAQLHVLGIDIFLGDDDPNAISANLMAEVTFNDGVNPFGQTVIRDWSHLTAAAKLNIPLQDIILQPGVLYQRTFEEELIDEDANDFWYVMGIQYKF